MYCKTNGCGENIYLAFHGWAGNHREFSAIASRTPETATFVSCDLPGYGNTPKPTSWNMQAIIDQIESGLANLLGQHRNITFVGFCSGVVLGMLLVRRRPECFKRIVMIDPFAFLPWYFRIFLLGGFGERAYRTTFVNPTGRKAADRILSSMQTSDADFTAAFSNVDHEVVQNYLKLFSEVESRQVFAALDMEVDIVIGEKTFRSVRKSARLIQDEWPETGIHELPRIGHLPLVQAARAIGRIIFIPDTP